MNRNDVPIKDVFSLPPIVYKNKQEILQIIKTAMETSGKEIDEVPLEHWIMALEKFDRLCITWMGHVEKYVKEYCNKLKSKGIEHNFNKENFKFETEKVFKNMENTYFKDEKDLNNFILAVLYNEELINNKNLKWNEVLIILFCMKLAHMGMSLVDIGKIKYNELYAIDKNNITIILQSPREEYFDNEGVMSKIFIDLLKCENNHVNSDGGPIFEYYFSTKPSGEPIGLQGYIYTTIDNIEKGLEFTKYSSKKIEYVDIKKSGNFLRITEYLISKGDKKSIEEYTIKEFMKLFNSEENLLSTSKLVEEYKAWLNTFYKFKTNTKTEWV